jgi:D-glycero-D-manno-heptose 1,7-bisphosphate phosphatase
MKQEKQMTSEENRNSAIFLDRDGVLNVPIIKKGKTFPPDKLEDFILLPGVKTACQKLKNAGFVLVVITNQPDVSTGRQKREVVEAMHEKLNELLPIDDIRVCYHVGEDNCGCRKPKPGMIFASASEYGVNLSKSFVVGDRWRDIEAGQQAGCACFFIDYNYRERRPDEPFESVQSLEEAAEIILSKSSEK